MFWFRQSEHRQTSLKTASYFAPILAAVIIIVAAAPSYGQSDPQPFTFRPGQSMYIVAFRRIEFPLVFEEVDPGRQRDYTNSDLDAERKVRKRIEEWQFFKVAEKPSEADFVFLVNLDESSIEGLAIPYVAYRRNFKERFDLDALRDAAYGRYLIGPLKIPTLSRLTDRLVQQMRERVAKPGK